MNRQKLKQWGMEAVVALMAWVLSVLALCIGLAVARQINGEAFHRDSYTPGFWAGMIAGAVCALFMSYSLLRIREWQGSEVVPLAPAEGEG